MGFDREARAWGPALSCAVRAARSTIRSRAPRTRAARRACRAPRAVPAAKDRSGWERAGRWHARRQRRTAPKRHPRQPRQRRAERPPPCCVTAVRTRARSPRPLVGEPSARWPAKASRPRLPSSRAILEEQITIVIEATSRENEPARPAPTAALELPPVGRRAARRWRRPVAVGRVEGAAASRIVQPNSLRKPSFSGHQRDR